MSVLVSEGTVVIRTYLNFVTTGYMGFILQHVLFYSEIVK